MRATKVMAGVAVAFGAFVLLGGPASAHVYFSDLTCDYVKLNSEYTT